MGQIPFTTKISGISKFNMHLQFSSSNLHYYLTLTIHGKNSIVFAFGTQFQYFALTFSQLYSFKRYISIEDETKD